jgi:hypothetical protein
LRKKDNQNKNILQRVRKDMMGGKKEQRAKEERLTQDLQLVGGSEESELSLYFFSLDHSSSGLLFDIAFHPTVPQHGGKETETLMALRQIRFQQ